jgi:molybdopterin converting factor subunit 1
VSTLTVQLFASYAESFGEQTLEVQIDDGATVRDLLGRLRLLPGAETLPESPRVAVNRKFASADQPVHPGDEIALIPPVAGG